MAMIVSSNVAIEAYHFHANNRAMQLRPFIAIDFVSGIVAGARKNKIWPNGSYITHTYTQIPIHDHRKMCMIRWIGRYGQSM